MFRPLCASALLALGLILGSPPAVSSPIPAHDSPVCQDLTKETFEKGHEAATYRSQQGNWSSAHAAWIELLEEHAGADYARPFLQEIREALRRAAFWAKRGTVDPEGLVSGRLMNYNRFAGKLRMEYTSQQLDDFETVANFRLHPLRFRGNYTIEVEAIPGELATLQLMVDCYQDGGYLIQAGNKHEGSRQFTYHTIAKIESGQAEIVEKAEPRPPKSQNKPVQLKVAVTSDKIKVHFDKRKVMELERAAEHSVQFGILACTAFDSMLISGTVEGSWIQDVIDASVQGDRDAFDETYEDPPALGAWEATPITKRTSLNLADLSPSLPFPDMYTQSQREVLQRIQGITRERKFSESQAAIDALEEGQFSPATMEFLRFLNWLAADRYILALGSIERLEGLAPLSDPMQVTEAILNIAVERRPRAIQLLTALSEARPQDPAFHAELAQLLMLEGKLDEARARIDLGLASVPGDAQLADLRIQVAKADQGPSWKRAQRATGEFFEVATDIDKRTAKQIAREADQALEEYQRRLGSLPKESAKRKLYLFSGSKTYSNYIDGVSFSSPESTAGVFSPRLKQILLWNQPDREATRLVLRHEVMHSFMDEALGESPIWFAEGMAEYYAHAKVEGGKWKPGQAVSTHLKALRHFGLKKLTVQQLIHMPQAEFMKHSEYCYPFAWALVHYLHHSSFKNEDLVQRLWALLRGEIDGNSAVHQVFGDVNLEQLNHEFWTDLERRL